MTFMFSLKLAGICHAPRNRWLISGIGAEMANLHVSQQVTESVTSNIQEKISKTSAYINHSN